MQRSFLRFPHRQKDGKTARNFTLDAERKNRTHGLVFVFVKPWFVFCWGNKQEPWFVLFLFSRFCRWWFLILICLDSYPAWEDEHIFQLVRCKCLELRTWISDFMEYQPRALNAEWILDAEKTTYTIGLSCQGSCKEDSTTVRLFFSHKIPTLLLTNLLTQTTENTCFWVTFTNDMPWNTSYKLEKRWKSSMFFFEKKMAPKLSWRNLPTNTPKAFASLSSL